MGPTETARRTARSCGRRHDGEKSPTQQLRLQTALNSAAPNQTTGSSGRGVASELQVYRPESVLHLIRRQKSLVRECSVGSALRTILRFSQFAVRNADPTQTTKNGVQSDPCLLDHQQSQPLFCWSAYAQPRHESMICKRSSPLTSRLNLLPYFPDESFKPGSRNRFGFLKCLGVKVPRFAGDDHPLRPLVQRLVQ